MTTSRSHANGSEVDRRWRYSARRPFLNALARRLDELGGDELIQRLFNALDEQLRTDGVDARDAFRIAVRGCRLAVLLLAGREQRAAARELGISERTAKYDAQRLRRVVHGDELALWGSSIGSRRDLRQAP